MIIGIAVKHNSNPVTYTTYCQVCFYKKEDCKCKIGNHKYDTASKAVEMGCGFIYTERLNFPHINLRNSQICIVKCELPLCSIFF